MSRFLLPLAIFAGLVIFLWKGLALNPREIPSTLIDKPAPAFDLSQLFDEQSRIANDTLAGKVWLLNVWASWCAACRQEHPVITELAREIDIVGLNYKDTRTDAKQWLAQYGNPYRMSGFDQNGDVGIDYGVYGVPETFVIDHLGTIRYKHIGPVSREDAANKLIPIVRLLEKDIN
jgi:cytochrome c biogenesis protein CcmG/thiol:disulfide interchange protein DsbE